MAFPFYPLGAISAALVLGGTLFLFRVLLLALDLGAAELRGSIGPGLVRGVRAWAADVPSANRTEPARPSTPSLEDRLTGQPASLAVGATLEELTAPTGVPLEVVRSRR